MRYFIITIFFLGFVHGVQSQEDDEFFFKEFSLSLNKSYPHNELNSKYGFGVGTYHQFRPGKDVNIILGTEFNQTRFFFKSTYEGHYEGAKNMNYRINWISLPLGVRFYIGNQMKVFLESGGYVDILIGAIRKGSYYTSFPDSIGHLQRKEYEVTEKISNSRSSATGAYLSFGIQVQCTNLTYYLKSEYKFELTRMTSGYTEFNNSYLRLAMGISLYKP